VNLKSDSIPIIKIKTIKRSAFASFYLAAHAERKKVVEIQKWDIECLQYMVFEFNSFYYNLSKYYLAIREVTTIFTCNGTIPGSLINPYS
jgi:hypothetical protein